MKVVLLLALVLVGAYAQTVTNWDLSEISPDSGIVEADKKPALTGQARKANNQGYTARYTQQGKTLKMSLTVHKENDVRVTDTDRLLFGMEGMPSGVESEMANITLSYGETASICESALGSTWETMVHLPTEDLTYVEALRLATSLNEYTLLAHGNQGGKNARSPPGDFYCICHGTAHHFQTEAMRQPGPPGANVGVEFKGYPYWGVKILGREQKGHGAQSDPAHNDHPYVDRDCLLCEPEEYDSDTNTYYDCRWCCFGKCVVKTPDQSTEPSGYGTLPYCDREFLFDDRNPDGLTTDDLPFNRYRINDIQKCALPRAFHCYEEVERLCVTCDNYIAGLIDTVTGVLVDSDFDCDYCNLAVGASHYHCPNCTYAIEEIYDYGQAPGFRQDGECTCGAAFWQIANSDVETQPFDFDFGSDEESDSEDEDDGVEGDSENGDGFRTWSSR